MVLSYPTPHLLYRIQLWRIGGQFHNCQVFKVIGYIIGMPTSTIHHHHGMAPRFCFLWDLHQVLTHDVFAHIGRNERFGVASSWTYRAKQMCIFKLLLLHNSWATSRWGPNARCRVLLAKTSFVLEPNIYAIQGEMPRSVKDRFQKEVFYMRLGRLFAV